MWTNYPICLWWRPYYYWQNRGAGISIHIQEHTNSTRSSCKAHRFYGIFLQKTHTQTHTVAHHQTICEIDICSKDFFWYKSNVRDVYLVPCFVSCNPMLSTRTCICNATQGVQKWISYAQHITFVSLVNYMYWFFPK